MTKPISPTAHAALDYGLGATLLTAPYLLGLSRRARVFFGGFGALAAVVNAFTDTPLSVRPVIPLQTHRLIDLATDPAYLLVPVLSGIVRERRARTLWLATTALLAANVALTDWDAPTER
ncbi:hypothetical protein [Cellulomonas aerilata]|uniref:Uncharacterized protein n=1 Tax=Cellulomonas aerilata TaxID=515326 RepID=A0A512DB89_9CELL|nr:hypothetical protein [Cellulomonas aerilata]GEO33754.1 hypothetical protein CAE01nite_14790 [Cellulomonas aerilata]